MPNVPTTYINFAQAIFRVSGTTVERRQRSDALLGSLVYRPKIFQRNDIRWVAAYSWRSDAKERGIAALKEIKRDSDPELLKSAAEPIAALVRQLFGASFAEAVTSVPCGHSRRPDCFGKRLAQYVGEILDLPFVQVFADRPCPGTSHPKQSARVAPLTQIADPPRSAIVIDDLATSGQHLEEMVLALRRLDVATSAIAWISGSATGGSPLAGGAIGMSERCPPPRPPRAPGPVIITRAVRAPTANA